MKRCVVCGRETNHKFEEYTVCAACDVDGSFDYYIKQSIAAQQSMRLTRGILRHPKHFFRCQVNPRPKLILPPPRAGNARPFGGKGAK